MRSLDEFSPLNSHLNGQNQWQSQWSGQLAIGHIFVKFVPHATSISVFQIRLFDFMVPQFYFYVFFVFFDINEKYRKRKKIRKRPSEASNHFFFLFRWLVCTGLCIMSTILWINMRESIFSSSPFEWTTSLHLGVVASSSFFVVCTFSSVGVEWKPTRAHTQKRLEERRSQPVLCNPILKGGMDFLSLNPYRREHFLGGGFWLFLVCSLLAFGHISYIARSFLKTFKFFFLQIFPPLDVRLLHHLGGGKDVCMLHRLFFFFLHPNIFWLIELNAFSGSMDPILSLTSKRRVEENLWKRPKFSLAEWNAFEK